MNRDVRLKKIAQLIDRFRWQSKKQYDNLQFIFMYHLYPLKCVIAINAFAVIPRFKLNGSTYWRPLAAKPSTDLKHVSVLR